MHSFAILIARFYTLNKTVYNKTQTTNGKLEFPFFKYMIFRYPLTNHSQIITIMYQIRDNSVKEIIFFIQKFSYPDQNN